MSDGSDVGFMTKPTYTAVQNIHFVLNHSWKYDKKLVIFLALKVFPMVLLPTIAIFLPKIAIEQVRLNVLPIELIVTVGAIYAVIMLLSGLQNYLEMNIVWKCVNYYIKFLPHLSNKSMDSDYENIESPEGRIKMEKAWVSAMDNGTYKFLSSTADIVSNVCGLIIYTFIIASLNPIIILLVLASALLNYFMGRSVNKYEHINRSKWTEIERKINYVHKKSGDFTNAKDVRVFDLAAWFQAIFEDFVKERLSWSRKMTFKNLHLNMFEGLLTLLRDGIAYAYFINMIINTEISVAEFVLYFGAVSGFAAWVSGIVSNVNQINKLSLAFCDLRTYLEMRDKSNRLKGLALPNKEELPCSIEFKDVCYQYPASEQKIINRLNLKITKGEKLAIVGLNGAGKTTIVKLLCGLYTPTEGTILINGNKSSDYNLYDYYDLFSVVFQDNHLLPVSISKNVALSEDKHIVRERVIKCLDMAGLTEKINTLENGLNTILMKSIFESAIDLSGGEIQKLLLARALYKDAPIIVLDEPTAALDPLAESELYLKYNELTKNKTSIFISHRLSSTHFCDKIIFLENGVIAEYGTHSELMEKGGQYANMYKIQSNYYKEEDYEAK